MTARFGRRRSDGKTGEYRAVGGVESKQAQRFTLYATGID